MHLRFSAIVLVLLCLGFTQALADTAPPTNYPDGAQGTVFGHCGVADECAALALTNGDSIDFFNEGAAFCKPFFIRIVRYHSGSIVMAFDSEASSRLEPHSVGGQNCPAFIDTTYTLDGGNVRLTFSLNGDGSLSAAFSQP
jgi:hypothetical protein